MGFLIFAKYIDKNNYILYNKSIYIRTLKNLEHYISEEGDTRLKEGRRGIDSRGTGSPIKSYLKKENLNYEREF